MQLIIAILIALVVFHLAIASTTCPLFCICRPTTNISNSILTTTVECQRISLRHIPTQFPVDARHIRLDENNISTIAHAHFLGLHNLVSINISSNQVISIKSDAWIDLPRLTTLDLRQNHLIQIPEGVVKNCTNITYINLNRNRIRELSSNFCLECARLEKLYIRNNELSKLANHTLEQFQSLNILDLYDNKLTGNSLERVWFPSSLEQLYLGSNHISTMNWRFNDAQRLLILSLDLNYLNNTENVSLSLEKMTELQLVNLSGNYFTYVPTGILQCRKLLTLDISNNNISTLHNVSFMNSLQIVYLNGNRVTDLPRCLFHGNLTEVHLERNRLRAVFTYSFCETLNLLNVFLQDNIISRIELHDFPRLQTLNLNNNNISELENIYNMPDMVILLISNNVITTLRPNVLRNLSSLERLHLSNNNIYSIENHAFENIAKTVKLIDISRNEIELISSGSFRELDKLEYLDISFNRLSSIVPFIFMDLKALTTLNVSYNSIVAISESSFVGLTGLFELDLRGNGINTVSAGTFSMMSNLVWLDLSGNHQEEIPVDIFVGLGKVCVLSLANNKIRSVSDHAFSYMHDLVELNLRNNLLDKLGTGNFLGLFSLNILDLSGNNIRSIEDNTFQQLTEVERIFLSDNDIWKLEGSSLSCLDNLKELWLDHNAIENITNDNMCTFKQTRWIDLSFNNIYYIASEAFANFPQLEFLNLKSNRLEAVPKIKTSPSLSVLNLSYNRITTIGANNFKTMPALTKLDLSAMCFDVIHANAFACLNRLENLNLENDCLKTLRGDVFEQLSSIRSIHLLNNPWSCDCLLTNFIEAVSRGLPNLKKPQMICQSPTSHYLQNAIDISPVELTCAVPDIYLPSQIVSAELGGNVLVRCTAYGIPEPVITWHGPGRSSGLQLSTAEGDLRIIDISLAQAGSYTCIATNQVGEQRKKIKIEILEQYVDTQSEQIGGIVLVTVFVTILTTVSLFGGFYLCFKFRGRILKSGKYDIKAKDVDSHGYDNRGRDLQEEYVTLAKHYTRSETHEMGSQEKWKDAHTRYLSREDMIEFGHYMATRTMGYGVIKRRNSDHLYINGYQSSTPNPGPDQISYLNDTDDAGDCSASSIAGTYEYSGPTTPIPLTPLEKSFKYTHPSTWETMNISEEYELPITMLEDIDRSYSDRNKETDETNRPIVVGLGKADEQLEPNIILFQDESVSRTSSVATSTEIILHINMSSASSPTVNLASTTEPETCVLQTAVHPHLHTAGGTVELKQDTSHIAKQDVEPIPAEFPDSMAVTRRESLESISESEHGFPTPLASSPEERYTPELPEVFKECDVNSSSLSMEAPVVASSLMPMSDESHSDVSSSRTDSFSECDMLEAVFEESMAVFDTSYDDDAYSFEDV